MGSGLMALSHVSRRSAVRSSPILRLLFQDRAAAQHRSAVSCSRSNSESTQKDTTGEIESSSADVSRILDGLRERLGALERAQADAVNSCQGADVSGSGRQPDVDKAGAHAPIYEQMCWAQRTGPQLFPSATAGLEDFEPADGDMEEEGEVLDPSQFDASELGDSAEARRLLSILCAPVRLAARAAMDGAGEEAKPTPEWSSISRGAAMDDEVDVGLASSSMHHRNDAEAQRGDVKDSAPPAAWLERGWEASRALEAHTEAGNDSEDAEGSWCPPLQDAHIPEADADHNWPYRQVDSHARAGRHESAGGVQALSQAPQMGDYGVADVELRPETVPVSEQRLLQAGIVGVPNSGKSTLTNALVGHKVSAVSNKTNTTDATRLGAFTEGPSQVALYDTPGVVSTRFFRGKQHAKRVRSAWGTASDCELLLFIVDAHRQITEPDERVVQLVEELAAGPLPSWDPPPALLLLNKIDRLNKEQKPMLGRLAEHLSSIYPFQDTFCISAKHGVGMAELRRYLLSRSTAGKWALQAGESTDMTPNDLAREVLKEKVFKRLYKELPYELQIEDVSFKTLADGSLRIEKNLMVRSDQIRRIVVGKQGAAVGEIGVSARKELEAMLQKRVHLMLNVKVIKKNNA